MQEKRVTFTVTSLGTNLLHHVSTAFFGGAVLGEWWGGGGQTDLSSYAGKRHLEIDLRRNPEEYSQVKGGR